MAVLDGERVLGVCSRHEIGMRLGARYGFPLFSQKPVRDYLSPAPVCVREDLPISAVLENVFSRTSESFYDDIVLLDGDGAFLGLIHVHTLVRLQTQFLRENIGQLEAQQRVIREKNQQMEEELVMAREIQLAMLPQGRLVFPPNAPPGADGIRFAHLYRPAGSVGGDFVHVVPISEHSVGIFISDVMGHGVRSALVTAMLRAMVEDAGAACTEPGLLLAQLNRALAAIIRQAGEMMYATAFYLVADSRAGTVRYATAGHLGPVRLNRRSGAVEQLVCPRGVGGPGLCIFENAAYGTAETALEGDDVILLFTDGLIEASDAEGELFGAERVCEALQRCARQDVAAIIDSVLAEAEQFAGGNAFEDDVCLAGVHVVSRNSATEARSAWNGAGANGEAETSAVRAH
ncbi:MAG: SpoIIE family protein phosphatase [Terrimicrobiaceae bacterium]|nr:SpoIIE family protein phosphatase [Terrimicrobiaceae bacterium]